MSWDPYDFIARVSQQGASYTDIQQTSWSFLTSRPRYTTWYESPSILTQIMHPTVTQNFEHNHIEGKIIQIWLANEDIFFLIQGKITCTWLDETQARGVSCFKEQ